MAAPRADEEDSHVFHIQSNLKTVAPHHENFKQLWETKWREPCTRGLYPFMFGSLTDFEPVVERLIAEGQKEPYDWDTYAQAFFPKAEELFAEAEAAEKEGNQEKASELYLRSSAVYRIARFPLPRSEKQRLAWKEGKGAAAKGLALRERPTKELSIPHKHGLAQDGKELHFYYHLPPGTTSAKPVPLVIIFSGLDGYRTELAVWIEGWSQKNVATVVMEIPGTGDSPADPTDPTGGDRVCSTLLDWIEQQPELDQKRKALWGFSTGGYHAIRLAHTHPDRLNAIVAHGGGCHYMFHPEWLSHVNSLEYPFDLANCLAQKFGYGDDVEKFKQEGMEKFSLLKDGTLDKPRCTKLLLINGMNDEIFPVDDYILALQHGAPKEIRLFSTKHMGEPECFPVILKWLYDALGLEGNPGEQLRTIPSRPKYCPQKADEVYGRDRPLPVHSAVSAGPISRG